MLVTKISAVGTRGDAKGVVFVAKPNPEGKYVLNKKATTPSKGNFTNNAVNKVYVDSLDEAARLLATEEYLINVVSPNGSRALRANKKVIIEYSNR